jgi:hypothetical protein
MNWDAVIQAGIALTCLVLIGHVFVLLGGSKQARVANETEARKMLAVAGPPMPRAVPRTFITTWTTGTPLNTLVPMANQLFISVISVREAHTPSGAILEITHTNGCTHHFDVAALKALGPSQLLCGVGAALGGNPGDFKCRVIDTKDGALLKVAVTLNVAGVALVYEAPPKT